jgi:hypothetical protein
VLDEGALDVIKISSTGGETWLYRNVKQRIRFLAISLKFAPHGAMEKILHCPTQWRD